MPNEPEREIEKTLKAYAQQRRAEAGAPREMHRATRRMLQAEAARTHAPARSGASANAREGSRMQRGWWPQWALVLSAVALLAVAITLFATYVAREKRRTFELSQAQFGLERGEQNGAVRKAFPPGAAAPAAKAEIPVAASPAPPPQTAEDVTRLDTLPEKSKLPLTVTNSIAMNEPEQQKSLAGNGVIRQTNFVAFSSVAGDKKSEAKSPNFKFDTAKAPQAVASTPAPTSADEPAPAVKPTPVLVASGKISAGTGGASATTRAIAPVTPTFAARKFARTSQPSTISGLLKDVANAAVLASFKFELSGDQVRIVDGDGSVYTGRLEQRNESAQEKETPTLQPRDAVADRRKTVTHGRTAPLAPALAANASAPPIASNYFFRVSGTNLSLQEPIIFTGTITGTAATVATTTPPAATFGPVSGKEKAANTNAFLPGLSNLHISGSAVIGTNKMNVSAKAEAGY